MTTRGTLIRGHPEAATEDPPARKRRASKKNPLEQPEFPAVIPFFRVGNGRKPMTRKSISDVAFLNCPCVTLPQSQHFFRSSTDTRKVINRTTAFKTEDVLSMFQAIPRDSPEAQSVQPLLPNQKPGRDAACL